MNISIRYVFAFVSMFLVMAGMQFVYLRMVLPAKFGLAEGMLGAVCAAAGLAYFWHERRRGAVRS
jgi:hypothetical protein